MTSVLSYLNPIAWFGSSATPPELSPDYVGMPTNEIKEFSQYLDREIKLLQSKAKSFGPEDAAKWRELVGVDYLFKAFWSQIEATYAFNNTSSTKFEASRNADLNPDRYHTLLLRQKIFAGINGTDMGQAELDQIHGFLQSKLPEGMTWALQNSQNSSLLSNADLVLQQTVAYEASENSAEEIEKGIRSFQEIACDVESEFMEFMLKRTNGEGVSVEGQEKNHFWDRSKSKFLASNPSGEYDAIFSNVGSLSEFALERLNAMEVAGFKAAESTFLGHYKVVFFNLSFDSLKYSKQRDLQIMGTVGAKDFELYYDLSPALPFTSLPADLRKSRIPFFEAHGPKLLPSGAKFDLDISSDYFKGKGLYAMPVKFKVSRENLTPKELQATLNQLRDSALNCS